MPVVWNLRKWLAVERDIYRASEVQALLAEKAGVQLSLQAVSALINGTPTALRLQTIQALCNALDCKLSDFCDVLPDTAKEQQRRRKRAGEGPVRLYGGKGKGRDQERESRASIFPDPRQFVDAAGHREEGRDA
jgi:DNA-binding Xre family transcriptional regulator